MPTSAQWVLAGLAAVAAIHGYALMMSRRDHATAGTAAFWCGLLGLLSLPVAIALAATYLPFIITGAGDHPLNWMMPAAWIAVAAIPAGSAAAIWRVRRKLAQPTPGR